MTQQIIGKSLSTILFMLMGVPTFTQTPISLRAAIDSAWNNNPRLHAARSTTKAVRSLEKSGTNLPLTSAIVEYGNINSPYSDTKLTISQGFSLPAVYRSQLRYLEAHTGIYQLQEQNIEQEIANEVTIAFYQLLVLQERKKLLLYADSLFASFLRRQEERFAEGDINVLEKSAAELQRLQTVTQLDEVNNQLQTAQERFNRIVNSSIVMMPASSHPKVSFSRVPDSTVVSRLPATRQAMQRQHIAAADLRVMQTRLYPQFSLGYANQSIRGVHIIDGAEKYYGHNHRFSSVTVAIDVPLFVRAEKARIAAARFSHEAAIFEYAENQRVQQKELQQLLLQLQRNEKKINAYEQFALKNAATILREATAQISSGDIGYIEWLMLVKQSIDVQTEYFNALNEWNETAISLNTRYNY